MQNSPPKHVTSTPSYRRGLPNYRRAAGASRKFAAATALLSLLGFSGVAAQADPATHLSVTCAAATRTTDGIEVTVTALDQNNNVDTSNNDNITWSSTDPQALTYENNLHNGVQTYFFFLGTLGSQTLTATDLDTPGITGTSNPIEVTVGEAQAMDIITPANVTAGVPFTFTVTTNDGFGNPTTIYPGTVTFASTDGAAALPADSTLTNGSGTFTATLNTTGNQQLFVTDTSNVEFGAGSNWINVQSGEQVVTHFGLVAPSTVVAGHPFTATIQALDASENLVPTYNTTISTTQNDPRGSSPPVISMKNGVATANVLFRLAQQWVFSAVDLDNASFNVTQKITCVPDVTARFRVGTRQNVISGKQFGFNLLAQDLYGNYTPNYNGTVHITSSDPQAITPPDTTLVNGNASAVGTLITLGPQTFTATDIAGRGTIFGTSEPFVVQPGPAALFKVDAPPSTTAGVPVTVTVTALDTEYNTSRFYTGTVHFSSNDPRIDLPADMTLTNGMATFSATFKTSGRGFITASDTATPTIKGTNTGTNVAPNVTSKFGFAAPLSIVAGRLFSFYVSAQDAYGNVTPSYGGRLTFSSSDPLAVLPGAISLVNGISNQRATFMTFGNETLTATDTVNSAITGTSDPILSAHGTR